MLMLQPIILNRPGIKNLLYVYSIMQVDNTASEIRSRLLRASESVLHASQVDKTNVESDFTNREVERVCKQYECALSMGLKWQRFAIGFSSYLATDVSTRLTERLLNILQLAGIYYTQVTPSIILLQIS